MVDPWSRPVNSRLPGLAPRWWPLPALAGNSAALTDSNPRLHRQLPQRPPAPEPAEAMRDCLRRPYLSAVTSPASFPHRVVVVSAHPPASYRLETAAIGGALAHWQAETIAASIDLALAERSGPRSPWPAAPHRSSLSPAGGTTCPGKRCDVLSAMKRWVPARMIPSSNALMLRRSLLARARGSRPRSIRSPPLWEEPRRGAAAYDAAVAQLLPGQPADLRSDSAGAVGR